MYFTNNIVWIGTQTEFDALLVLDDNVLYIILEEEDNDN